MTTTLTAPDPTTITCHYCKSPEGQPCLTAKGVPTNPHKARIEDAADVLESHYPKGAELLLPEYQGFLIKPRDGDYLVNGRRFRRVSTVLGVINKHLENWIKNITLERVGEILLNPDTRDGLGILFESAPNFKDYGESQLTAYGEAEGLWQEDYEGWVKRLLAAGKLAADEKRDEAAERGHTIHEEIDHLLGKAVVPDLEAQADISPQARHAIRFLEQQDVTLDATEMTVWDSDWGIAGTIDGVGRDGVGRRCIWDWKTGKGVYPEMAFQLGAYSQMLGALTGEPVEDAYIVKLTSEDYEVHRVDDLRRASAAFYTAGNLQTYTRESWFVV